MNGDKIIIFSAHPDDYELGMGMRIRKYADEGMKITSVIATEGEYSDSPRGRQSECEESAKILGISQVIQIGLPCARLSEKIFDLRSRLEEIIKQVKPDIGYTIYPRDTHTDHQIVSLQSLIAMRSVPKVYYYKVYQANKFIPNIFFFGNSRLHNIKMSALRCYKSEIIKKGTIDLNRETQMAAYGYHSYLHHSCVQIIRNKYFSQKKDIFCELFEVERLIEL